MEEKTKAWEKKSEKDGADKKRQWGKKNGGCLTAKGAGKKFVGRKKPGWGRVGENGGGMLTKDGTRVGASLNLFKLGKKQESLKTGGVVGGKTWGWCLGFRARAQVLTREGRLTEGEERREEKKTMEDSFETRVGRSIYGEQAKRVRGLTKGPGEKRGNASEWKGVGTGKSQKENYSCF